MSCTSCSAPMMGGGVEFFAEEPAANMSIPDLLAKDKIPCVRKYESCVYSAQGALMCNIKSNGGDVKEKFVPGMVLGGLPNFPSLPGM